MKGRRASIHPRCSPCRCKRVRKVAYIWTHTVCESDHCLLSVLRVTSEWKRCDSSVKGLTSISVCQATTTRPSERGGEKKGGVVGGTSPSRQCGFAMRLLFCTNFTHMHEKGDVKMWQKNSSWFFSIHPPSTLTGTEHLSLRFAWEQKQRWNFQ